MIKYVEQVLSTNVLLRELSLNESLEECFVLVAHHQSAGRGQQGNRWESERGKNLTFSVLFKPFFLNSANHFLISQAVSVAIVEWLSQFGEGFSIKWPNDIYHNDRKIAGILIENDWQSGVIVQSIVGIGLNVNQIVFVSDAPNPISLKGIFGRDFELTSMMEELYCHLMKTYNMLREGSCSVVKACYLDRFYRINLLTHFCDSVGMFDALVKGVNDEGLLRLQVPNEIDERLYSFKEVSWLLD